MQADASLAGRTAKCRKCGQPVKIPGPQTTTIVAPSKPQAAKPQAPLPPLPMPGEESPFDPFDLEPMSVAPPVAAPPRAAAPKSPPAKTAAKGAPRAAPSKPLPSKPAAPRRGAGSPPSDDGSVSNVTLPSSGALAKLLARLRGSGVKVQVGWGRLLTRVALLGALLIGGYFAYGSFGWIKQQVMGLAGNVEMPDLSGVELPNLNQAPADSAPAPPPAPSGPRPAVQAMVTQFGTEKVATLVVTDTSGRNTAAMYEAAARGLADEQPGLLDVFGTGSAWTISLAPVVDLEVLRGKITFGTVGEVNTDQRSIAVSVTTPLPPPQVVAAPTAPVDPLDEALEKLQSSAVPDRVAGGNQIVQLPPNDRQREVAAVLEDLVQHDAEMPVREIVALALKTWADADSVPAMIAAIDPGTKRVREHLFRALVRLKADAAAEVVAKYLVPADERGLAAETLVRLGLASEKPTIDQLRNDDWGVRYQAVRVLQQIGTKRSFAPLDRLVKKDPSPDVRTVAGEAIAAIATRYR